MWCIFNTVHFVHSCDAVASVLFFEEMCNLHSYHNFIVYDIVK